MRRAALALLVLLTAGAAADDRRSGFDDMSHDTQAMQRDDSLNPGMLSVADGEALWSAPAGEAGRSCASCHGEAKASMRGVAARYPRLDATSGRPIDLQGRIAQCRAERQQAPAMTFESPELLALSAYVAHQSRGMPIEPDADARLSRFRAGGEALWRQRQGQLDLACADCHDDNAGKRLAGAVIPQAHPTGYPIYRLEWQGMGSLQRRLRGCLTGIRAEPYPFGAPEYVDLELYLKQRARGMPIETPGVRP
jgi:L-cysteine S-thiosulfotransferase